MILAVFMFIALTFSLDAQLPEQFALQTVPASITGDFVRDTDTNLPQTFTVRVQNKPPNPSGTYFVTFSAGQSGNFTARQAADGLGNFLAYQVYDNLTNRNILKDLTGAPTSSEVISGSFITQNPPQNFNHDFTVVLPGNQIPVSGTYTDTLVMTLYYGTLASYIQGDTKSVPITFTVTIPTEILMSLVPEGNAFDESSLSVDLNFGTVFQGAERTADLIVKANTTYSVGVTSTAGGVLKHTDMLDPSTVPYDFTVNGSPVPLPAGFQTSIATGAPPTPPDGELYRLTFKIGDLGTASSGDYADTLSLTVTAY